MSGKFFASLLACSVLVPASALAQDGGAQSDALAGGDIIVTAQKKAETINSVPLSIVAASGEQLAQRGIQGTADLVKIVPGLSFAPSPYNSPVYTLRGVGFYENTLASSPTVSVYFDEVPLAYPAMTQGPIMDIQRVEVLKGPQGTLYGQNSTGGAINYIANRPTDHFETGGKISLERFGKVDLDHFVSGPITSTLKARAAIHVSSGGDWQKNLLRDEKRGKMDQYGYRFLVDWDPSDTVSAKFNFSGYRDNSDTPANLFVRLEPTNAARVGPELAAQPVAPRNLRYANWSEANDFNGGFENDAKLHALSARFDVLARDNLTLTSISSYQYYDQNKATDLDGTAVAVVDGRTIGRIKSFDQEVRASGTFGALNLIVGGNYSRARVRDSLIIDITDSTVTQPVPGLPPLIRSASRNTQKIESLAVFANAELGLTDRLKVIGGLRYTDNKRDFRGCGFDGDGRTNTLFEVLAGALYGTSPTIAQGACISLNPATGLPEEVVNSLDENNVAWRLSVDYEIGRDALVYASVSKGFKSGSFSTLAASNTVQFDPIKQESVLAYEAGIKTPLLGRKVNLSAAAFYYDYRDKQLLGRIADQVFGPITALVNIPKSEVWGFEAALSATPFRGLNLSLAGSYTRSEVLEFEGFTETGEFRNLAGSEFFNTPRVQFTADAEYAWGVGASHKAFIGGNARHQSVSYGSFVKTDDFRIAPFTLLDLRAGFGAEDGSWTATVFGRNVTNKYYYNGVYRTLDTVIRQPGRPAVYGISLAVKFD